MQINRVLYTMQWHITCRCRQSVFYFFIFFTALLENIWPTKRNEEKDKVQYLVVLYMTSF